LRPLVAALAWAAQLTAGDIGASHDQHVAVTAND